MRMQSYKPNEFRGLQLKDKETRGLRNLINFCEDEEIDDICGFTVDKWRHFIKIRKSGVTEVYITGKEVQKAYASCPEEVKIAFKLLVSSGNKRTFQIFFPTASPQRIASGIPSVLLNSIIHIIFIFVF